MSDEMRADAATVPESESAPDGKPRGKRGAPRGNENSAAGYENLSPEKRLARKAERAQDERESATIARAILRERGADKSASAREAAESYRRARVVYLRAYRAAVEQPPVQRNGEPGKALLVTVDRGAAQLSAWDRMIKACDVGRPEGEGEATAATQSVIVIEAQIRECPHCGKPLAQELSAAATGNDCEFPTNRNGDGEGSQAIFFPPSEFFSPPPKGVSDDDDESAT